MQPLAATLANATLANATAATAECALPYEAGRLPLLLLYSAVLVVGLPANLLTALLTWRQVRRKNVLAVYLCGLSLCDLGYLGTLPLWADYVSRGHHWRWSSVTCRLTGFVFFTNMYVSVFLLCCISCDRYVAVRYSLEARGLRRQRVARRVALAIVAVVALGHAPVFIMPEGEAAEGERRCFEPAGASATVAALSFARFAVGFLAPLAVLVASNCGVLAGVRRSTGLQRSQKERVRRLAVAVVVLFLLCFGPYHMVLLARGLAFHLLPVAAADGATCQMDHHLYTPYSISLALATVNSAANPVLYVLSSHNIRRELRRGLARACSRAQGRPSSSSSHNHNHNQSQDRDRNQNQIQKKKQEQDKDQIQIQNQNQSQIQNQIQILNQDQSQEQSLIQNQDHIQDQNENQRNSCEKHTVMETEGPRRGKALVLAPVPSPVPAQVPAPVTAELISTITLA